MPWAWVIFGVVAIVVLFVLSMIFNNFWLWVQARLSGAPVGLVQLFLMKFRKVSSTVIVQARITAMKAGIDISANDLEAHYLAGGNVIRVVNSLIAASKAGIPLAFKQATSIDLAGRDILEAVKTSVNPKVIDCPSKESGKDSIEAVAADGIQLKVRARVTVRTNIGRLVGGATEETIVARVGEGIVTTIGSAGSHKDVLANPDKISKTVMEKGLDNGTAFEILSIDIADVDVGENIGARLQTDQAEADKRVAQANAEKRRAMAIAQEQEMKAATQENRAKVVLAEAQIPMAIAEAFRGGRLGVMDYYRMQNVQADTQMRDSIAKPEDKGPSS